MKKYSFHVLGERSGVYYLNMSVHFTDKIFLAAGLIRQSDFDSEEEALKYWTKLRQGFLEYKKSGDDQLLSELYIGEEVSDEVMILPYYKFK